MARYAVLFRDTGSSPSLEMVRDGFSILGFLLPPLWLAWHRLWIETAGVVAAMLTLALLGEFAGLQVAAPVISTLLSVFIGLEGAALRVAALRRRGWTELGAVEADSTDEADSRAAAILASRMNSGGAPRTVSSLPRGMGRPSPSLSFFGYPD